LGVLPVCVLHSGVYIVRDSILNTASRLVGSPLRRIQGTLRRRSLSIAGASGNATCRCTYLRRCDTGQQQRNRCGHSEGFQLEFEFGLHDLVPSTQ
jgi:hypothetical protein